MISPTCLRQAFMLPDFKAQKYSQVINVFLSFWDLGVQKLLVKHWLNQLLGGNSQNIFSKFVRFFCNFQMLLQHNYCGK